jgi:ribosomal protein S18 acetylase RimI-like enzyme
VIRSTSSPERINIRSAATSDRLAINNLINFEQYVHRHMDWRMPLDWIGRPPFLVAERFGRITAVLACPPDPEDVAWIRAFAANSLVKMRPTWSALWPVALRSLREMGQVSSVVSIALEDWYRDILVDSGFHQSAQVILLSWENGLRTIAPAPFDGRIRPMTYADLPDIHRIDSQAFDRIWCYSEEAIQLSFEQALIATVAEDEDGVCGYQVSTPSPLGGHLARLAVDPVLQQRGIGYALVEDLLARFKARGAMRVTVNTQEDNLASRRLYEKTNFHPTGEKYPVYQFDL